MEDMCRNPYCLKANQNMRSPSSGEFCVFKSELDIGSWHLLDKGQIKLMVCEECREWTAEVWDQKKFEYISRWACKPFRFDVGVLARVIFQGEHYGKCGNILHRKRIIKPVYPPPVPENYYTISFEKGRYEKSFKEDDLEIA